MKRRLTCSLLCAVALGLLGCAPTGDDTGFPLAVGGGKSDDLVGRDLVLHVRSGVRRAAVPGWLSVEPTVDEHWSSVEIWTDDVRIERDLAGVVASVKTIGFGGDYGMVIQSRGPQDEAWATVRPVPADSVYHWVKVTATRNGDQLVLFGEAVKIEDHKLGLTRMMYPRRDLFVPLAPSQQLRFLLIPLWNFWDWDSKGYEQTIRFEELPAD